VVAKIIRHAEIGDVADDIDHPIPALRALDVCALRKGGGAKLVVVIAKPLQADEYSQHRLLDKIQGYLGYIASDEFHAAAGPPTPGNTSIEISIHPDSDPAIFDLLERCKSWVASCRASLCIDIRVDQKH
jgi:hypothetical protein